MPNLIIALLIISILILVHELGHFLAAKLNGIGVEEFGIGYPPRLWAKKKGNTIYSVNALPFGGFVKLLGEEESELEPGRKKMGNTFFAKSKIVKIMVILAGVTANFLLGAACFALIYARTGIPEKAGYIIVQETVKSSPAEQAGIEAEDKILAINGTDTIDLKYFSRVVQEKQGQAVILTVEKPDKTKREISVVPRIDPPDGEGAIGVLITEDYVNTFYPWYQMPIRGTFAGIKEAVLWGWAILTGLGTAVRQLFIGVVPEVAGPVRIVQMTGDIAAESLLMLVKFTGILSVNLAILNVLPIPALDGGRLAFLLIDPFIKKEKRAKIESTINAVGMAFIIIFMIVVTINDTAFLLQGSSWVDKLTSLWPF